MISAASLMDCPSGCRRDVRPPMATYSPSLWGDIFSTFSFDHQVQKKCVEAMEPLKKEARSMLLAANSGELIALIDKLERLGLAYHFETEIEEKLHEMSEKEDDDYDLFTTALRFRLLRQHQYHVSCAHARIHGEGILEEAVAFTTHHLSRILPQLESPLKDKVKRALEQALHRGVPIIETRIYLSLYERDESRDELLLKLAKLNFSFLQNLYRKELSQVSRWWNGFDLKTKLPYARDRLIECYLWGVSIHFEPQYSDVRIAVAKSMQMVSTMDDTYDNYATLEEADLLTEVLERAYNQELKWIMEREMPTFEEYIKNSVITSCIYVMFTALIPGMKSVTKETVDWLLSEPNIVISTARMGRHLEDLGSHERENRGGKMLTVVDCYMQQHGVSKQETLAKFAELVEDGWKNVTAEWVAKTSVAKEMVEQLLNYARIAEVTYKNSQDGYTNPDKFLAPQIAALFVDPIAI
ncbi:UNVERIFIED_CONTAM: Gamma-cadinene synthase [Sesamum calycinum]|uniref:Gamma-cadinene synthase n=1 Tax=Sesamum calycinum TaxID=2727403 RepID=A0AAW2JC98_9LAMI